MRERDVKRHLLSKVASLGGECRKLTYEGRRDAPDWMVLVPNCLISFVELKRPGAKARKSQQSELELLDRSLCVTGVAATPDEVDEFLLRVQETRHHMEF